METHRLNSCCIIQLPEGICLCLKTGIEKRVLIYKLKDYILCDDARVRIGENKDGCLFTCRGVRVCYPAVVWLFSPFLSLDESDLLSSVTPKSTDLQLIPGQLSLTAISFERSVNSSAPHWFILNLHVVR